MFKKITFIFALALLAISACKKKTDTPAPKTNYLTVTGTIENVTEVTTTTSGYTMTGLPSTGVYEVSIDFPGGKPTASFTDSLSSFQSQVEIEISNVYNNNTWLAASGAADVTVSGNAVTVSFSNVIFAADTGNTSSIETVYVSGSLYSSN